MIIFIWTFFYYLFDPITPATKCFCIVKNTTITGAIAITIATINAPYSTKYADDNELNTNVNVFCPSDCNDIRGHIKLFQLFINDHIAAAANVDFIDGTTILKKIVNSFAPSSLAASIISVGYVDKFCLKKNIKNIDIDPGNIIAQWLSTNPILATNWNNGIIVAAKGIIIESINKE